MLTLFKRELLAFFGNITAYVVIILFLVLISLFMWVFPGDLNVLDSGYANIDTLFAIAPFVFMFLVPAVSMRLLSEEKKSGTMELLLTRPISEFSIVLAKFLAAFSIVVIALLPTLVYYVTVYYLGNPVGNLDSGGAWGAYLGLLFLAAVYASIGVFSSSLSDNQIISLLVSILLIFVFYMGFDYASAIFSSLKLQAFVISLGINEHYKSISRGVVDSRDLVYFLSVISVFLLLTKSVLQSRKW